MAACNIAVTIMIAVAVANHRGSDRSGGSGIKKALRAQGLSCPVKNIQALKIGGINLIACGLTLLRIHPTKDFSAGFTICNLQAIYIGTIIIRR
jgi:hypothetical protein